MLHRFLIIGILFGMIVNSTPQKTVLAQTQKWCDVDEYEEIYDQTVPPVSSILDLDGDRIITRGDWLECAKLAIEYLNACGFTTDIQAETLPCDPDAQKHVFSLESPAMWLDTRLNLNSGQTFIVTASGQIDLWPTCEQDKSSSEGMENVDCSIMRLNPNGSSGIGTASEGYPLPGHLVAALIGRVGDGNTFQIGMGGQFTADQDGTLQIRINDSDDLMGDDRGSFSVVVSTAQPGSLPGVQTRPRLTSTLRLNVRSGPGVSCPIIGAIEPTDSYIVEGKNSDRTWFKIITNSQPGWVSADFVNIDDTSLMFVVPEEENTESCLSLNFDPDTIADVSAQLNVGIYIDVEGSDLPVIGYTFYEIVKGTATVIAPSTQERVKALLLGPGFGVLCLGVGNARSDNPAVQRAIEAGDITCAYAGAGAAIVALTPLEVPFSVVLGGAVALYPFVTNPDKYIGTVVRNEIDKLLFARKISCDFAGYLLDTNPLTLPGCG